MSKTEIKGRKEKWERAELRHVWAKEERERETEEWEGRREMCVWVCVCDWVVARLGRQYQTVHQCHSACVLCKPFHPSAWKAWLRADGSAWLFTYSTWWHTQIPLSNTGFRSGLSAIILQMLHSHWKQNPNTEFEYFEKWETKCA